VTEHVPAPAERDAILRVVTAIDLAADAGEWGRLLGCFTDQVTIDNSSLSGLPAAPRPAAEAIGDWRDRIQAGGIRSLHLRSGCEVRVCEGAPDEARVASHCYAINAVDDAAGDEAIWEVWARWTHDMQRGDEGWRCAGFTLERVASRGGLPQ
jgi:hypothetical protein